MEVVFKDDLVEGHVEASWRVPRNIPVKGHSAESFGDFSFFSFLFFSFF